jgi:hypothetical protein
MIKNKLFMSAACAIVVLVLSGTVFAHHGTPAYENKVTELKGATVTRFAWSNPRALIDFDAKDANGKVQHWVVETAAPQALILVGWAKTSLVPGDVITVYVFASKTGNPVGRLNHIILADGSRLDDTVLGGEKHPN